MDNDTRRAACGACGTPYAEDAAFCDNCGVAAATEAASAQAAPVSETLAKIRSLVRDKTRFEPEDIQPVSEDDAEYPYEMEVGYAFEARVEERNINGHFKPRSSDVRGESMLDNWGHAASQRPGMLRQAMDKLEQQLRDPETAYNQVESGLYLGAAVRYYDLDTCTGCAGQGKNRCHVCHGRGSEGCHHCYGNLQINCTNFSCSFGKVNCSNCYGSGQTQRTEYYTEYVTVYHNNGSETVSQPRSRTVYDRCNVCFGGKVDCGTCYGTAKIRCPTCFGTGEIRCNTCAGRGELKCTPCDGSGEVGGIAWSDVHVAATHAVASADGMPDDARQIVQKEGPHPLAAQASGVRMRALQRIGQDEGMVVRYKMPVRLVRLAAQCGEACYKLVAYGRELRWLTLDNMVEDLLQRDLQALNRALALMADDGLFATDVQKLLEPLQHVAASELNADVVEAVLDGEAAAGHAGVISQQYAETIEKAVLGSLRHVYTRFAKRNWWQGMLAALLLALGGWWWSGLVAGLLLGALALPASLWLFRHRLRKVLAQALGGDAKALRAMALARKGKRDRTATFLVLAPVVLALAGSAWLLPKQGPHASAATAAGAQRPSPAEQGAISEAMKQHKSGAVGPARATLEVLAQDGNKAAYGPYGWMVLLGEGLSPEQARQSDMRQRVEAARPWAEKAMAVDDAWGYATQGMIEINKNGGHFDMEQGLRHLESAAERGHLGAMHFLGMIHFKGVNVPVDLVKARKWVAMGAARDEPAELYNLGMLDWTGAGLDKPDRASAMNHWRRAAKLGNENARKALKTGRPVE
ncbi:hypothetical protein [Pseudoduganella sp.]|uniref:hypothetical protein n=1 Tax=Pseudoduganella sp. TaxID=1880898 RepID=UPI0035AE7C64